MSHFTEMEVVFDVENQEELVAALEKEFGKGNVEVNEEPQALFGYEGKDRSKANKSSKDYAPPCEIIVRREHVGAAANDVGFRRGENGKFIGYVSEYDRSHTFTKQKQGLVAQEYALSVAEKTLKAQGWKTITRQKVDGGIKVTAKGKLEVKLKNW